MVRETCILKWPVDNLPFLYYFYLLFHSNNATPKQIDVAIVLRLTCCTFLPQDKRVTILLPVNRKFN